MCLINTRWSTMMNMNGKRGRRLLKNEMSSLELERLVENVEYPNVDSNLVPPKWETCAVGLPLRLSWLTAVLGIQRRVIQAIILQLFSFYDTRTCVYKSERKFV
jgi:hypothetical protein